MNGDTCGDFYYFLGGMSDIVLLCRSQPDDCGNDCIGEVGVFVRISYLIWWKVCLVCGCRLVTMTKRTFLHLTLFARRTEREYLLWLCVGEEYDRLLEDDALSWKKISFFELND